MTRAAPFPTIPQMLDAGNRAVRRRRRYASLNRTLSRMALLAAAWFAATLIAYAALASDTAALLQGGGA
jgi:hypothetical protein